MPARSRELRFHLTADTRGLRRGLGQAERNLHGLDRSSARTGRRVASNFARVAGPAGIGAVGLGLAGAVKAGMNYERQMSGVRAVTRANGRQMRQLGDLAMKMGADTAFSAGEAAGAMGELAKGGLSVEQIMRGGLKSALSLAAAGELELADAAAITANAMNLFGMEGREVGRVADAMATAANQTTADVSDFGMALSQSGSVAKSAGLSFTETMVALEALAASGIKNSDAGTSLKTAMIQLIKPTEKQAALAKQLGLSFVDAEGNMRPLEAISAQLRDRLGEYGTAQRTAHLATLAGTDGVRTLTALYEAGPKKLEAYEKGLLRTGSAAETARIKQDNFAGDMEKFRGSLETVGIALYGKFQTPMRDVLQDVTKWVNIAGRDLDDFFETVAQDPKFKGGDLADKIEVVSEELERRGIPQKIARTIGEGVVSGLEVAARSATAIGPRLAVALVQGFLEAPVWARALGTAWLLRKLGGRRAAQQAGAAMAGSFTTGMTTGAPGRRGAPQGRLGRARGAAGRVARGFGGAQGIGVGAAVIGLPELQRVGTRGRDNHGLQGQSALQRSFRRLPLGAGVQRFVSRLQGRSAEHEYNLFGNTAGQRFQRLTSRRDLGGLQQLSAQARQIARDFPKARKELERFAGSVDRQRGKLQGGLKINMRNIVSAADLRIALDRFRDLRTNGAKNIHQLRTRMALGFKDIKQATKDGSEEFYRLTSENFGAGIRAVQVSMRNGSISTKSGMREIESLTRQNMTFARRNMSRLSFAGRKSLARNMQAAAEAVREQMNRAGGATQEGMRKIRRYMREALRTYGFSAKEARLLAKAGVTVSDIEGGEDLQAELRRGPQGLPAGGRATGGYIGRPGERGRDAVHAVLGRGEFVANRHQQHHIEQAMAVSRELGLSRYGSLDELAGGVNTPHYFARGGMVRVPGDPNTTGGRDRVNARIANQVSSWIRRFKIQIGYAYDPGGGHQSPGHNVTGTALDVVPGPGGSWNTVEAGLRAAIRSGKKVLYGTNGIGIAYPNHGRGHHAHVEWGGGGAVGGAGVGGARIRRVRVRRDLGVASTVAQAAVDQVRRAAQSRLDSVAAQAGASGVQSHGAGPSSGSVIRDFRRAIRATGASPKERLALWEAGIVESGLRNLPYGDRDSVGVLQERSHYGSVSRRMNPYAAALRFLREARAMRPFRGSAGALAQAVQRSAFPARYDQVRNRAMRYMARGGRAGGNRVSRAKVNHIVRALRVSRAQARRLLRRTLKPADLRRLDITPRRARHLGLRLDPVAFRQSGRQERFKEFMERATEGGEVLERAEDRVGYLERRHGLTEEDLGTEEGRRERLGEIGQIQVAQRQIVKTRRRQLSRVNNASVLARKMLNAAEAQERGLTRAVRGAKRGTRERRQLVRRRNQASGRVRRLEEQRREALTARREADRALRDARLDVDETSKAIAEVNAPVSVLEGQLEEISLREAAGHLSAEQAFALRDRARKGALAAGGLTQRDRWRIEGAAREDAAAQRVDPLQAVSDRISEIDLRLRAGDFGRDAGAERAAQTERERALQEALNRADLTAQERLSLRADLNDLTEAINADKAAREEHAQATKDLVETNKQILAFADRAQSVELGVVRRAIADIISGELASNYGHRARAAGNGMVAR